MAASYESGVQWNPAWSGWLNSDELPEWACARLRADNPAVIGWYPNGDDKCVVVYSGDVCGYLERTTQ